MDFRPLTAPERAGLQRALLDNAEGRLGILMGADTSFEGVDLSDSSQPVEDAEVIDSIRSVPVHYAPFRILRRIVLIRGAQKLAAMPEMASAKDFLASLAGENLDAFEMAAEGNDAEARDAAAGPLTPGQPHPLLQWLLSGGGVQWVYAVAQIVASLFGVVLPPLPPIPKPPPIPAG
ncbi:MAG TPA: hypothetical protein VKS79_21110 [Gemmataceae bacterium]|nr:hypothetical protein [Gemmataceae bacterium]